MRLYKISFGEHDFHIIAEDENKARDVLINDMNRIEIQPVAMHENHEIKISKSEGKVYTLCVTCNKYLYAFGDTSKRPIAMIWDDQS